MLIPVRDLQLIAEGRITMVFRRWVKPTVRSGGTLRTAVGVLAIESVEPIVERDLVPSDARAAGFTDLQALHAALSKHTKGTLYRVRLHLHGSDPRVQLRETSKLSPQEVESLRGKLGRMDLRSSQGPWTFRTLEAIRSNPCRRAADLALMLDLEKDWLKASIRKLKELGLTESLEVGYRLSPRGEALVSLTTRGDV